MISKKIFIPVVGQFTNVGDTMHRRQLLSWLGKKGELHVYIGTAPEHFINSLQLVDTAITYKNLIYWLFRILVTFGKNAIFIFNPGEMNLGL